MIEIELECIRSVSDKGISESSLKVQRIVNSREELESAGLLGQ